MSIDDLSWKIIVPISVVILITLIFSTYLILAPSSSKIEALDQKPKIIEVYDNDNVLTGATYNFEPFVLNLEDGSGILNLKVAINIFEFQLPPFFIKLIPAYRDQIIAVATSYNADQLSKSDVRTKLKVELLDKLNSVNNGNPEITNLYFEEFVVR